jgi:hypothetical protein
MNRIERLVGLLAAVRPEPIMTVARTVADVLSEHVAFEVECIDRMYLGRLRAAVAVRGWSARVHPPSVGFADRLDRPAGSDHRHVHHSDTSLRPGQRCAVGGLRQGPTQGRRDARVPRKVLWHRGCAVRGPCAREDLTVSHREPSRCRGPRLSVDRADHRAGQPVLLLLRRCRLRPVLPQVLLLFP